MARLKYKNIEGIEELQESVTEAFTRYSETGSTDDLLALQDARRELKLAIREYRSTIPGMYEKKRSSTFGEYAMNTKIGRRFEASGKTATEIAQVAGVSTGYIRDLASGRKSIFNISFHIAISVAKACGCKMEDLIEDETWETMELGKIF